MSKFITLLLILVLIGLATGFFIKTRDAITGDFIIGISTLVGFFILMPLFIYHRWKNKNFKDYMLSKENIDKMKEYNKSKKR